MNAATILQPALLGGAPVATSPAVSKRHFDAGESSEWYTPARFIEAARATMGGIDLDPASCALANATVKAARFFDRQQDGLSQQWRGRVWINPPYSDYRGQAAEWASRLLAEYLAGRVQQAVLLVNLSTAYQAPMQQIARLGAVCLVAERIAFCDATGRPQSSPTQANVLFYLGERRQAFGEQFRCFGAVLWAGGEPAKGEAL